MHYETLSLKVTNGVATVTINRPCVLNALNLEFFTEFKNVIDHLKNDESIRLLVITGQKTFFSSGVDIKEMAIMTNREVFDLSRMWQSIYTNLVKLPFITIAAVNGIAYGSWLELAMSCDIRIASDNAQFCSPEINLWLIPWHSWTQVLPKIIWYWNAIYLFSTWINVTAIEALKMGLLQEVVAHDELYSRIWELCEIIISRDMVTQRKIKELVYTDSSSLEKDLLEESITFSNLFGRNKDCGIQKFIKKT